jgi:hypothetical protein
MAMRTSRARCPAALARAMVAVVVSVASVASVISLSSVRMSRSGCLLDLGPLSAQRLSAT